MGDEKIDIDRLLAEGAERTWHPLRIAAVLALVVASLAGWYLMTRTDSGGAARYTTQVLQRGTLTTTVTAVGTVEPTSKVEVSSELSGTIRTVEVNDNDQVTRGQVLARLDTTALEAGLAHSRATLAARKARVTEAEATRTEMQAAYLRADSLFQRGVTTLEVYIGSEAALRRAEAALASAEADVAVAEADVQLNEANLAKACICAPIDGLVLDRNVDAGQIVAASLSAPVLFTLAEDLRRMELRVDVDEADIGRVAVGNSAEFSVEAFQDRDFPATVSTLRYFPKTVDGVVTYQAVLEIDNADLLLRPGMTAVAVITVGQVTDALLIPNAALRFAPQDVGGDAGGTGLLGMLFRRPPSTAPIAPNAASVDGWRSIWVLRDGTAVKTPVRTGASDGSFTEFREGELAAGDRVITDMDAGT
ncbi:efflux RND transporter periplasmic adaptor subunit [Pseudogemmobacter sp. W21_MBD1_M6]|uniref:efflux RND transporter periplasmic adaptor subunit n=1 Tax=Pseudogemmobacter sp. W21_MBD1_M6 TaxID=3240271 RepID=UPI003F95296F